MDKEGFQEVRKGSTVKATCSTNSNVATSIIFQVLDDELEN